MAGSALPQRVINQVSALAGPIVARSVAERGVKALSNYLMSVDEDRAIGDVGMIAASDSVAYSEITDWLQHEADKRIRGMLDAGVDIAKEMLEQIRDVSEDDTDGKIAGDSASDKRVTIAAYKHARAAYDRAARAAGGRVNLQALEAWMALDGDLKEIVRGEV